MDGTTDTFLLDLWLLLLRRLLRLEVLVSMRIPGRHFWIQLRRGRCLTLCLARLLLLALLTLLTNVDLGRCLRRDALLLTGMALGSLLNEGLICHLVLVKLVHVERRSRMAPGKLITLLIVILRLHWAREPRKGVVSASIVGSHVARSLLSGLEGLMRRPNGLSTH